MTIEELIQALGQSLSFKSRYDEENEEWVLEVAQEGGRRQEISLNQFEHDGSTLIRLVTGIASTAEFGPSKLASALEMNASLVYGAVAIYQGSMVITAATKITTGIAEIVDMIKYLTRIADLYEKMLFGHDRA